MVDTKKPKRPLSRQNPEKHDYEPGESTHPMESEPQCVVCGTSKNLSWHR